MICSNCSFALTPGAAFCSGCGVSVPQLGSHTHKRNLASIIMKALAIPTAGWLVTSSAWIFMPNVSSVRQIYKTLSMDMNYAVIGAIVLYGIAHSIDFKHYVSKSGAGAWAWALELTGILLLLPASVLIAVRTRYHYGDYLFIPKNAAVLIYSIEGLAVVLFAIAVLLGGLRSRKLPRG